MRLFEDRKQLKKAVIVFLIIAASVTFALGLVHLNGVLGTVRRFLLLFVPFYVGFGVAYILNPLMKLFENKVFGRLKRKRLKRILSVIITYILLLAFLVGLMTLVIPNLVNSVVSLASNLQSYYEVFTQTVNKLLERHPSMNELYVQYSENINDTLYGLIRSLTTYLSESVPKVVKFTTQLSGTLVNIFIGFVISVYFLLFKERIAARGKRALSAMFSGETKDRILRILSVTDLKTGRFIISRIIDALIMWVLCFTFMSLFKFPYPMLNSVIIGVFNLIPVFGSIISAIITALLVLITKPSAFFFYLLFIIVIQQIDGNIIGPKIQGDQLGISALWIMFAVILFGGLFGVLGMIIGVPVFAVIYYFADEAIRIRLKKKNEPEEPEQYLEE